MRRPTFRRTATGLRPEFMSPVPRSPTAMSLRGRDTGFPESFCGVRNTTLRHPDAKPDACITQEDVDPKRALLRHHQMFMIQREREGGSTSTAHGRQLSTSSDEGDLTALGRLAISSLRAAERPGSRWSKDADSVGSSDGLSSSPSSPTHLAREFSRRKVDPRTARNRRPRGNSFISRLVHR